MIHKTAEEYAHEYVTKNPDSEIRRMYGHHWRSYFAGFNQASSLKDSRIEELENLLLKMHENSLYKLNEHDDRIGYLPSEIFDEVEKALRFKL